MVWYLSVHLSSLRIWRTPRKSWKDRGNPPADNPHALALTRRTQAEQEDGAAVLARAAARSR